MTLKVGDRAPDFELTARRGGRDYPLSLRVILAERHLVLYFYPRDFTSVCTREACLFRDAYAKLSSDDTEVVGVSADDASTHDRFAVEHAIPFPLVSDPTLELARRYGATSLLRDVMGVPSRVTYIIGQNGKIEGVFDSVASASKHIDGARGTIQRLRAAHP